MENGEHWDGEHYFGYLDTVSHLDDPPRKRIKVPKNAETLRNGKIVRICRIIIAVELIAYALFGLFYK